MVVCEIIDHGPGVPEQLWQQIFTPFQRFGDRQAGGIGPGSPLPVDLPTPWADIGACADARRRTDDATHVACRFAGSRRQMTRILLVDDEPALVRALTINLRNSRL